MHLVANMSIYVCNNLYTNSNFITAKVEYWPEIIITNLDVLRVYYIHSYQTGMKSQAGTWHNELVN